MMKTNILTLIFIIACTFSFAQKSQMIDNIVPNDTAVQTANIQKAIDKLGAKRKGGVLRLKSGVYVSGTLHLKSNVELHLDSGAVLLGSTNPYDYKDAFIECEGQENVKITGLGTIDGRGLEVALAIDSLHHIGERIDSAYNYSRMRPGTRPKLLLISKTNSLVIENVKLRSSASWGLSINKCNNVKVTAIDFVNRAYWNNDGIDIVDSKNVKIDGCDINSADDGIVLKSFDPNDCDDNIEICNCHVISSASAIKMGTESFGGFKNVHVHNIKVEDTFRSAIAIESVDGAFVDNILVDSIDAQNTGNAIFIRLGHRNGDRVGELKNVTIRNLNCTIPFDRPDRDYDMRGPDINVIHNPFPSSITGIPGHNVENVNLENIDVTYPGRGTKGMAYVGSYRIHSIPEVEADYPEFHMFGELPAWALYVRHVDGISFKNVNFTLSAPDYRKPVIFDDVEGINGLESIKNSLIH